MSINDFMLFHSRKLESLRTCMDFNDFARERIYERIPPKASSLEKTACVARMSAESLKWLIDDTHTRYNRLNIKARGERLSPFVFQSWPLYPNYWLFEVVKASILAGSYQLESKGYDSLAPDRQSNPEFNKRWPKTPGATAFWGASMSTAEAISGALLMFLKKSFLWAFPELPNYTALRPELCEPYDKENLERNFSETGDVLPLIPTWQNLSLGSVVEYISPVEWPPAKLDREYSRVMNLINYEVTRAQKAEARLPKPAGKGQENEDVLQLAKAERLAYQSYDYAITQKPELADTKDDETYDWLKENGPPDYELPSCETWKRQVRAGRKRHGTQKNTLRAGRSGHSTAQSG
ncbi:MAG: hypothetical protein KAV87_67520, partial [Desulfobacteraceae bacterium]|nr:hypothetical protein [Desulfobacteraceae bacterium]